MVIFDLGTRVRLKCDSTQGGDYPGEYGLKDQTGEIVSAFDTSDGTYLVQFDEPVPYNTANEWDDEDQSWWCKVEELEFETLPMLTYDPNQQGDKEEDI